MSHIMPIQPFHFYFAKRSGTDLSDLWNFQDSRLTLSVFVATCSFRLHNLTTSLGTPLHITSCRKTNEIIASSLRFLVSNSCLGLSPGGRQTEKRKELKFTPSKLLSFSDAILASMSGIKTAIEGHYTIGNTVHYHAAKVLRLLVLINHLPLWQAMEMLNDNHLSQRLVGRCKVLSSVIRYFMCEVVAGLISQHQSQTVKEVNQSLFCAASLREVGTGIEDTPDNTRIVTGRHGREYA